MKPLSLLIVSLLTFISATYGQTKKELDRKAIKDMCGCYEITFEYAETFSPNQDYEKKPNYFASAMELALPIADEENKISIQHLLLVNDSTVIKHWRQDWLYENQEVFYYDKDNIWTFQKLPAEAVKGQWTQKVYQVDDSPRYSGTASWVHVDDKHYWENKTDSPLPRREYTKRNDYNVMLRGNRHEITAFGWIHAQDNDKIIRENGKEDVLLAQEKGMNSYTRVDSKKCEAAIDWWTEHGEFWSSVRDAWGEVYPREGNLILVKKVDNKPLYRHLYPLEKKGGGKAEIIGLIKQFIVQETEGSAVGSK
ncbi:DUF6607 family protein [Lentiprolixibacter aurantiacus]|uniref:Uncharacterized protein n=1 Tax=Lentiprolixibacter aurantiacus TaxID=2993939 RepID=A0AAE3MP03_9FLAO|nr:DUF6607 family protein [Lentiprolixibacter aurantiacus]MCX2720352.1 hypothetical protein [Lentiprolixibacter aurantiacus]